MREARIVTPAEAIAVVREALDGRTPHSERTNSARAALALIEQEMTVASRDYADLYAQTKEEREVLLKAQAAAERERDNAAQISGMVERQLEARIAQLEEALRRAGHELDQWVFADGSAAYRVERAEKIIAAALASGKEEA